MDFKTIVNGPGGLAAIAADTLLVVLVAISSLQLAFLRNRPEEG